jgi:sigma-E factor negative regulatory protein RseA
MNQEPSLMSDRFSDSDPSREALSALADGEAHASDVARACAAWKDDAEARASWHGYQLIGDVMRSDDLARASRGDVFLKNFRDRLAQEPVVLAPAAAAQVKPATTEPVLAPQQAPALKRRMWAGPMGVAAGFVLMVGALINTQFASTTMPSSGVPVASRANSLGSVPSDFSLAVAPVPAGTASFVSVGDVVRGQGLAAGGTFVKPEAASGVMSDPRVDHVMAAQRVGQADESFSSGAVAQQVVFDGR